MENGKLLTLAHVFKNYERQESQTVCKVPYLMYKTAGELLAPLSFADPFKISRFHPFGIITVLLSMSILLLPPPQRPAAAALLLFRMMMSSALHPLIVPLLAVPTEVLLLLPQLTTSLTFLLLIPLLLALFPSFSFLFVKTHLLLSLPTLSLISPLLLLPVLLSPETILFLPKLAPKEANVVAVVEEGQAAVTTEEEDEEVDEDDDEVVDNFVLTATLSVSVSLNDRFEIFCGEEVDGEVTENDGGGVEAVDSTMDVEFVGKDVGTEAGDEDDFLNAWKVKLTFSFVESPSPSMLVSSEKWLSSGMQE